jgi:colicin import membrane protein/protein TonB
VSGAGTTALGRPDRLWPAVAASVAAHAAFFALAAAIRPGPTLDPGQRPIVARLVRLGEERPKALLPRREEPAAAEATAPAATPSPAAVPVPEPKVAGPKPAPPAAARPAAAAKPGRPAGSRLSSVVSELRHELQAGSPDGDPSGDAAQAEGDQYQALVVQALRQNYRLPSTISDRERLFLHGTLILFIEPDGRILRYEFTTRSGNPVFDDALERAVRETHLPPPPTPDREGYRRRGLEVDFKIKS